MRPLCPLRGLPIVQPLAPDVSLALTFLKCVFSRSIYLAGRDFSGNFQLSTSYGHWLSSIEILRIKCTLPKVAIKRTSSQAPFVDALHYIQRNILTPHYASNAPVTYLPHKLFLHATSSASNRHLFASRCSIITFKTCRNLSDPSMSTFVDSAFEISCQTKYLSFNNHFNYSL